MDPFHLVNLFAGESYFKMASKNGQTHGNGSTIQELKKNVQKTMENDGITPAKRLKSENGSNGHISSHVLTDKSFKGEPHFVS